MRTRSLFRFVGFLALALVAWVAPAFGGTTPIRILFLGDNGAHRPEARFAQIKPVLARRGIEVTYTDKVEALDPKVLRAYDGLIIYANTTKILPEQEKALLDFVEEGKGFIPIHCASYCFHNSPKYIELVGAQFKSHGQGTFRTTVAEPDHPIMKGYTPFESWDETYVHTRHNTRDRTVLEHRVDAKGKEPWTWVRSHGKGRVFYTAWGHDQRTWGNPGFHDLLERGIRWAVGRDPAGGGKAGPALLATHAADAAFKTPEMTPPNNNVKPFEYIDVGKKIPNYKGKKGGQGHLSQMQLPLDPEESLKHLVVPRGFRAELFAAEPQIKRPICMNWDERGRLWIAESVDYPNELKPRGEGRDRIVILEDTNGDGKADKFTVFADKLSIPTSIAFHQGGVIVFDGRQTLYLKDTDGDGKADVRRVLFGTWGMGDTHGGPSNMQYGLDNWIYGMQGYNFSTLTLGGESHRFRQGFYRFKPDGSKMEFLRSTNNNTWGIGMSEEGLLFGSTANGNPSVYMAIPNRYYEAVRGWAPKSMQALPIADTFRFRPITDKVRQVDWFGGYTAAAGHALYTARAYPKEYWNRTAFVNEPTGHLVGTFVLRREGSDFRSSNPFNLVASDDEWTAPIMAEVGPDGNVWVIDWYNYIVQHNPTPQGFKTGKGAAYETELRDKTRGRIYRIVYEGKGDAPKRPAFSLAGASPEQLVAALKNDNFLWRKHAQRLLVERGNKDVVPALIKLVADTSADEIGLNVGAIHALWTLHGLGALDGKNAEATAAAVAALRHPSPGVRRNAAQVLPPLPDSAAALVKSGAAQDPDPLVRLAALLALADLPPTLEGGRAVAQALTRPENTADRWIPDAATSAGANNGEHFLKALAQDKPSSAKALAVIAIVAEHYARGGPADSVKDVIVALAEADPAVAEAAIRGLAKGWPRSQRPKLDAEAEKALARLVTRLPAAQRATLVQLAGAWGSKALADVGADLPKQLLARVRDEKLSAAARGDAARELIELRPEDKKVFTDLVALLTPQTPPDVGAALLSALQKSQVADAGSLLADLLPTLTPGVRAAGIRALLARQEWTKTLLERVEKGEVPLGELSLEQKEALAAHPNKELQARAVALLKKGGALPNADRQKVLAELLPLTKEKGDPVAGKLVFKNACAKCHIHTGEGTHIGPDLTGMAVHPKEEMLLNIIDPSRSVEGNYRVYTLITTDGVVLNGLLAAESKTAVELIDAEGKKQTVLRENIDRLVAGTKSLMPDGFEKQLNKKELTDLLEFLAQRGKYVPIPLDRVATVVSTRGMFHGEESTVERLVFSDWRPKTFEGVPFVLVDPQGDRVKNVVLLYGPQGVVPPKMPRSVALTCNTPAKAIHLLSGVGGWAYPFSKEKTVSMIVRLHYEDGKTEDHALKNGEHFADYIKRNDVPGSKFAYNLGGRQVRYLSVTPQRAARIDRIEFVKGPDATAPIIVAVTIETRDE